MSKMTAAQREIPRGENGQFLPRFCDDQNCDGELEFEIAFGGPYWICNGLTHKRDNDPLEACDRMFPAGRRALQEQKR